MGHELINSQKWLLLPFICHHFNKNNPFTFYSNQFFLILVSNYLKKSKSYVFCAMLFKNAKIKKVTMK